MEPEQTTTTTTTPQKSTFLSRRKHHHPSPPHRPTALLNNLTLLTLLLPPALYLVTLTLTIVTIRSPNYVQADVFTSGPPETAGQFLNKSQHLSPFHTCTALLPNETDPFFFEESCARRPFLGARGVRACEDTFFDVSRICEKVTVAAELYVAAAVLSGVGLLLALVFAGLAWRRRRGGHLYGGVNGDAAAAAGAHEGPASGSKVAVNALGSFATLLALAGCGCLVMGQIVGVSALVIEASPDITAFLETQTRFYMDKGALDWTSAGYVCGFAGVFIAATGCGIYR